MANLPTLKPITESTQVSNARHVTLPVLLYVIYMYVGADDDDDDMLLQLLLGEPPLRDYNTCLDTARAPPAA